MLIRIKVINVPACVPSRIKQLSPISLAVLNHKLPQRDKMQQFLRHDKDENILKAFDVVHWKLHFSDFLESYTNDDDFCGEK